MDDLLKVNEDKKDNGGNGKDKDGQEIPQKIEIKISLLEKEGIAIDGTLPQQEIIALGMLAKAEQLIKTFYLQDRIKKQQQKESIVIPGRDNIKTGFLRKLLRR